jgi:hypothetical protein
MNIQQKHDHANLRASLAELKALEKYISRSGQYELRPGQKEKWIRALQIQRELVQLIEDLTRE